MGRRGPKSVPKLDLYAWDAEWLWFFSGLRNGFPAKTWYSIAVPKKPRLQTHPILLAELRKKPIDVKREKHISASLPMDRKTWVNLLAANMVRDVRRVCKSSKYWSRESGDIRNLRACYFLGLTFDLAPIFLAAKREERYPKSTRPTSDGKRMRFLARAMAGACLGLSPRYTHEKFLRDGRDENDPK
jgi:hypothetical protein